MLDTAVPEKKIEYVRLKNAQAKDLAKTLTDVFQKVEKTGDRTVLPQDKVDIIADSRTNGLYIADLDRSGKLPVLSRIVLAAGDPKGRVAHMQPRFSPDGRSLGYLCDEGGWLIPWVLDVASGRRRALTDLGEVGAGLDPGAPLLCLGRRFQVPLRRSVGRRRLSDRAPLGRRR